MSFVPTVHIIFIVLLIKDLILLIVETAAQATPPATRVRPRTETSAEVAAPEENTATKM